MFRPLFSNGFSDVSVCLTANFLLISKYVEKYPNLDQMISLLQIKLQMLGEVCLIESNYLEYNWVWWEHSWSFHCCWARTCWIHKRNRYRCNMTKFFEWCDTLKWKTINFCPCQWKSASGSEPPFLLYFCHSFQNVLVQSKYWFLDLSYLKRAQNLWGASTVENYAHQEMFRVALFLHDLID